METKRTFINLILCLIIFLCGFSSHVSGKELKICGWVPTREDWHRKQAHHRFFTEVKVISQWSFKNNQVKFDWGILPDDLKSNGNLNIIPCLKLDASQLNQMNQGELEYFFREIVKKLITKQLNYIELNIERNQDSQNGIELKKAIMICQVLSGKYEKKIKFVVEPALIREWDKEDWIELDKYIDEYILMLYDYGKTGTEPQNPAPLQNVKKDLELFLEKLNKPEKVILGIPTYGFVWEKVEDTFTYVGSIWLDKKFSQSYIMKYSVEDYILNFWEAAPDGFSNPYLVEQSENLLNWDEKNGAYTFDIIRDDRYFRIYYEDVCSNYLKVQLARKMNLAGVCFWSIGTEDPCLHFLFERLTDSFHFDKSLSSPESEWQFFRRLSDLKTDQDKIDHSPDNESCIEWKMKKNCYK